MAARFFGRLRAHWRELSSDEPGKRFENRWRRNRDRTRSILRRVLVTALGIAAIAGGLVLAFTPGPAFVLYAVGGGLIAEESRIAARLLDGAEMKSRRAAHAVARSWREGGWPVRSLWVLLGAIVLAVPAFVAAWAVS